MIEGHVLVDIAGIAMTNISAEPHGSVGHECLANLLLAHGGLRCTDHLQLVSKCKIPIFTISQFSTWCEAIASGVRADSATGLWRTNGRVDKTSRI
jgi:hypothetical protein